MKASRLKRLFALLLLVASGSCQETDSKEPWYQITGRDEKLSAVEFKRQVIYQARVPKTWLVLVPEEALSLSDTTLANCTFQIDHGKEFVKITVHSFPSSAIEERIPPAAQIGRWLRQFEEIDPSAISIVPEARAGFAGYHLEACGRHQNNLKEQTLMLAWAMQLDPSHYHALNLSNNTEEHLRQLRADYTIKAVGPKELVEQSRDEILTFARSFELIDEIPSA